jgi:4-amino-4-deoxy-L-arabinose transferase-like glycosyltransferase
LSRRLPPKVILGAILAIGLGLRLWGIAFSASTPVGRPDEDIFAIGALHMFGRPYDRLDTGWPAGIFTVCHAVLWLEHAWYRLRYGVEVNMGCLVAVNSIAAYLPIRVVSAVLGTATAWIVGGIARELAPERTDAPLWAAALYAVNYLVGRDGHFAVSDALLCFEISLALLFCARATTRNAWWLVGAAFWAGTAFSTKYSAIGLVFPCVAAAVETFRRERAGARAPVACAVLGGLVGILLVSPDIATHWSTFRAGLFGHFSRYGTIDTPPGAIFYPRTVFPAAFGWPGFLLCVGGLVWCLRRRVGVFLVVYVAMFCACVLGPVHAIFVRYASPVVPAMAAAGGIAASVLYRRLSERGPPWLAWVVVASVALALPAWRLAAFDRLLARRDTRDLAQDWLVAHGPGQVVLTEGTYAQVHAVDPSVVAVCQRELPTKLWRPTPILLAPTRPQVAAPGEFQSTVNPRWLPVRLSNAPALPGEGEAGWERIGFLGAERFVIWEYDQRVALGDLHAPSAPDFLSRAEGPRAIGWVVGRSDRVRPVDPCWAPVAGFSAGQQDAATWDTVDAFLVPFENFGVMERPGPEISIYRNACKAR